jgi:hypothetical protein
MSCIWTANIKLSLIVPRNNYYLSYEFVVLDHFVSIFFIACTLLLLNSPMTIFVKFVLLR